MLHDDMELFRCDTGDAKTPRQFVEEGFTKGILLDGQGVLQIQTKENQLMQFTFRSVAKEHFLMTMKTIADKLYDEG